MKVNFGKSHLLLSGNSRAAAMIDNSYIELEEKQVLLGITIDSNLTFENHTNIICQKTSQKLHALERIAPYMNIQKRRTVMKSFVTSQFSYCPLIWMFHGRRLNNKINSIHERALRITYQDSTSFLSIKAGLGVALIEKWKECGSWKGSWGVINRSIKSLRLPSTFFVYCKTQGLWF